MSMQLKKNANPPRGAMDILEEATHLLRNTPATAWLIYLAGMLPFLLGLLYFWGDMTRHALSYSHLAAAAFGLTLLFIWMKTAQARFAGLLMAQAARRPRPAWKPSGYLLAAVHQTIFQSTGLFLLPLALLLTLPYPWAFAVYQNLAVTEEARMSPLKQAFAQAHALASKWPMQNATIQLILSLLGLFVFINVFVTILALPFIFNRLTGFETQFSLSGFHAVNTTLLAATMALTYLCIDPLQRAVYALRCLYGLSETTGEDLRSDLARTMRTVRRNATSLVLVPLCLTLLTAAMGRANPPAEKPHPVTVEMLDATIDEVMRQRHFTWRMPIKEMEEKQTDDSWLGWIIKWLGDAIRDTFHWLNQWTEKLAEWLRSLFEPEDRSEKGETSDAWVARTRIILYVLVGLVALAIALFLLRHRLKSKRQPAEPISSEGAAEPPDLAQEYVAADTLTVDRWLQLAREKLQSGEMHLAVRAYYLAVLAHLAAVGMLTLARHKSNYEYLLELRRRLSSETDILATFSDSVATFDRVWYGSHQIGRCELEKLTRRQQRILAFG